MRINKYISESGLYPRRETDRFIAAGRITINGQPCTKGAQVEPGDLVAVDGEPVTMVTKKLVYLALNKPAGITCTSSREVEGNIIDFVGYPSRIFAVGRLDKYSEGLILLTNDGSIVNRMMHAENGHEKEYLVAVDKPVTDEFLHRMAAGVDILGTRTLPCETGRLSDTEFRIVLKQGLNLQIRRMCKELGYRVLRLERIRIMNIVLSGLERGQWRHLEQAELAGLFALLNHSED